MEKEQMTAQESLCIECEEAITNPVCPECLEREVSAWLRDKDPQAAQELMGMTRPGRHSYSNTGCIICKQEMTLCAHCHCKNIMNWLQGKNEALMEEFKRVFNFELITPNLLI